MKAWQAVATVFLGVTAAVSGQAFADGEDPAALAGVYIGRLPCPDCQGIDTRLTLSANGTYTFSETRAAASPARATQPRSTEQGHWSLEWNSTCVRLHSDDRAARATPKHSAGDENDPGSTDRIFAIDSDDALTLRPYCGEPFESPVNHTLTRIHD